MLFDQDNMMILHGSDVEAWTRRFGIIGFCEPCIECGKEQETTLPFAVGEFRGLVAPKCECGHAYPPYAVVKVGEPLFANLQSVESPNEAADQRSLDAEPLLKLL